MGGESKEEETVDLRSFLEGKEEKQLCLAGDRLHMLVLLPVKS